MKKRKLLLLAMLLSFMGNYMQAQLSPGSIAFTGFNCDGDDDLAIVALDSLPPFTQIIFCDSEWNGTQFGTDEGDFTWNSGASGISAGTIISFTLVSSSLTPSQGSIAVNNAGGISGTSDAVFAFTGTPPRTVNTFLAAIANSSAAYGSLSNTGLSLGLTAITLPEGSDIGQYNGLRSGMDKNGFLLALNTMTNWQIQDGSTDNQNDMIAPDLPWNMTPFTFTSIDATAPIVTSVSVLNQFSILINFSEAVLPASVTNLSNYSFNPTITIDSVFYQPADHTATLYHSGFQSGMAYTITVSAIEDLAGNLLNPVYISPTFYYNESIPALIFTEIMYNAPSSNSNQLEFVEIYNNGTSVVSLGGLVLKDAGNFVFTFPEMTMNPQSAIVLATDKTSAEAFYGGTFLDLPPAISNVFGNGGELIQLLTSNGTVICEVNYDDAAPWPTAPDGSGPSLELINASGSINDGANWTASTNLVGQSLGLSVFASPGVFTPLTTPTISFVNASQSFSESDGIVTIPVSISGVPAAGLDISLQLIEATAQLNTDFMLSFTHHVNGPHLTDTVLNIPVELLDNSTPENARFFTLEVSSNQANPGNEIRFIAFMLDDDAIAPVPTQDIYLSHVSSYLVKEGGSAEILSWDAASQRIFVVNSVDTELVILDFSSPENIQAIDTIDMSVYGSGITSVASRDGILAVTVDNGPNANGLVVIFNTDGVFQTSLVVGNLPDHLSFTPDGSKILTANEGQPSNDYLTDPEGTVTVIDISGGIASLSQSNVNTLNFNAFDTQLTALKNAGIRIFGPNASVSQDVEPEYITYNNEGTRAFVSLQENNAIAVVDLDSLEITAIWPMGYKNHLLPQNAFDGSDKTDTIIFANWPVKGMYMPDALAYYEVNGQGYYVTTNEGDAREYSAFEEEIAISALVLDSLAFPNRFTIQSKYGIGRMSSINTMGDMDQDGDMDELYVFGGRSFCIYNASTGEQVFDSGDDFERIIASHPVWSSLFNASNENNNFKNRSDNKGPEPEAITIHAVNGIPYAFIGLERMGGVMTYDLSNPLAPVFVDYINTRELGANEGGDLGPEGIIFIPYGESPTDTSLVVVANEISGTISVFSVQNEIYLPQNQDSSLSIFVFSDPHYMDTSLLINDGAAFQTYLAMDRKMLKESQAILEATIDTILAIHPDIVLVTGDLTKDGEYASHTAFASYLQTLENQGIKTFVIPGNHDINNPHALAFDGSSTIPVAHVSPAQFDSIYANFGFNEAIATDPNSLSYLVEPFPGFQILALDVCKYEDNLSQGHPETSGEIPYDTYEWINDKIAQANASGKYIIAMMHHGANEHYVGQSTLFSEYVVDGWDTLSSHFADMGLKAVFTGHYHAQDIVEKVSPAGHEMYDIETGSLVTWPSPFRLISMDTLSGDMSISGGVIENIDYNTNGVPFQTYAHTYLSTGLPLLVNYILMNPPYSLDAGTASSIEPVITEAFMAHYHGNEGDPSAQSQAVINMMLASPLAPIAYAVLSIWNDPQPDDWNYAFNLNWTPVTPEGFNLTIFHNNDGESKLINAGTGMENYGGVARFKTLIDELRDEVANTNGESITISSGDNFLAGPQFNAGLYRQNGPMYDAVVLDSIQYDAICLGNHDFDFGPSVLARLITDVQDANTTFLSSNLNFSAEPSLNALKVSGKIADRKVVVKDGRKIGIIGLTTPLLDAISSPGNTIIETNLDSVVQAEVNHLKLIDSVNIIVLISHLQDISADTALIAALTDVDVVIAGGGDEVLGSAGDLLTPADSLAGFAGPYPLKVTDANNDTVLVVTTPGEYRYVGRLSLTFDEDGKLSYLNPVSGIVLVDNSIVPDQGLQSNVVDSVSAYINSLSLNVIASSQVNLDGIRNHVRGMETNLGNLTADAILWQAQQLHTTYNTPLPVVSIQNGGGIRNNAIIPAGPIDELDTWNILPFDNFVSIVKDVTPSQFKEMLENCVSASYNGGNIGNGRFGQVGGFRFEYDTTAQSLAYDLNGSLITPGERIWSATLDNGTPIIWEGQVLPGAPNLTLATINFLAAGGDQYPLSGNELVTVGVTYQQALYNYLQSGLNGVISANDYPENGEGRILFKENLEDAPWTYSITADNHSVYIPQNLMVEGMNLESGDYIGVFFDSLGTDVCAGFIHWNGNSTALSAWGADLGLDGFALNEAFRWRIFDSSEGIEYLVLADYNTVDFTDSSRFIVNGLSGINQLEVVHDTQYVLLKQGWSMISTYIEPFNPAPETVFEQVILSNAMSILKDNQGSVYWPAFGINSIGNLTIGQGYKVKMFSAWLLAIKGNQVQPESTLVSMAAGWNTFAYLRTTPAPISQMLNPILSQVRIVKNTDGFLYWPQYNVNQIVDMIPGQGYHAYLFNAASFFYPANTVSYKSTLTICPQPIHFVCDVRAEMDMTLLIPLEAWSNIPAIGDEVGVLNENDELLGAAVFNGGHTALTIWGDEEMIGEGSIYKLKVWSSANQQESLIDNMEFLEGSDCFTNNGIAILKTLSNAGNLEISVYPNPASDIIYIQTRMNESSEVYVELYDISGRMVKRQLITAQSGLNSLKSHDLNAGIYQLRVMGGLVDYVQKIVISK